MSWKTAFLSLASLYAASCAEKVSSLSALSASVSAKPLKCGVFSDSLFQGRVAVSRQAGKYVKGCFDLSLLSLPGDFFASDSLYLQIYPLEFVRHSFRQGPALKIKILDDGSHVHTVKSIDRKLALRLSDAAPSVFFDFHTLQVCQVSSRHKALQIIVFKEEKRKNIPLRESRFLLPPFSQDPLMLGEAALRPLHPFHSKRAEKRDSPAGGASYMQRLHASLCPSS